MNLNRDDILGRPVDLPREEVHVPEWGGSVWVRMLTGAERDRFEMTVTDTQRVNFRARLVVMCACDERGIRLFHDGDVLALGNQPAPALVRLADVALRLNKFTSEDVDELEKNSEPVPSDGLLSA